jgi:hypothetical protein
VVIWQIEGKLAIFAPKGIVKLLMQSSVLFTAMQIAASLEVQQVLQCNGSVLLCSV